MIIQILSLRFFYIQMCGDKKMNSEERRENIELILKDASSPITASVLAKKFSVSRQIIVGDVALMRAAGIKISATPRGYILNCGNEITENVFTVACCHDNENMYKELYAVVDNGGTIIDVIVEHPIYGEISGELYISSRYDADMFLEKIKISEAQPLMCLTDGIHLHTIRCKDEKARKRIIYALKNEYIILEGK